MSYLTDIKGNKENETVNRLFAKQDRIPVDQSLKDHFKLKQPFCIVGLRIPFNYIDENSDVEGDIDVFFIQLTPDFLNNINSINPDIKKLPITAFEVKTGYLNKDNELKSAGLFPSKNSTNMYSGKQDKSRKQAQKLVLLGFETVALMHVFPTELKNDNYDGMKSYDIASDSIAEVRKLVTPHFFHDENDKFSTFYFSIGTIPERQENESGVLTDFKFRYLAPKNPVKNYDFQQKLKSKIMSNFPFKLDQIKLPILFLACKRCKNLYLSAADPYKNCPKCNSGPW